MAQSEASARGLPILIGVLCILAVGMTAATLSTVQFTGGESAAFVPPNVQQAVAEAIQEDRGQGNFNSGEAEGGQVTSGISLKICIEFLNSAAGTLLVFGTYAAAVGLIYRRFNFPIALLSGWILISPTLLFYFLFTNCGSASQFGGTQQGGGRTQIGNSLIPVSDVPPALLVGLIGIVLLGAVGLLYRSLGEEEVVVPEGEGEDDEPGLDRFAEAAGRAADRIEEHNADVDNAVYRAWVEMTGLLDVDRPEMYTPGEFADAAIDLGMSEDDVGELTRLFNEVRYGGMEADEEREDRAVEILRNIEEEYGVEPDDALGDADADGVPEDADADGNSGDADADGNSDDADADREEDG